MAWLVTQALQCAGAEKFSWAELLLLSFLTVMAIRHVLRLCRRLVAALRRPAVGRLAGVCLGFEIGAALVHLACLVLSWVMATPLPCLAPSIGVCLCGSSAVRVLVLGGATASQLVEWAVAAVGAAGGWTRALKTAFDISRADAWRIVGLASLTACYAPRIAWTGRSARRFASAAGALARANGRRWALCVRRVFWAWTVPLAIGARPA